jgi:hypothetical protein
MVLTVSFVLSPGSDALCPRRLADDRCAHRLAAASPQDLTHRPRASGPHDFSVRAHPPSAFRRLACARRQDRTKDAVRRRVVSRLSLLTGFPALQPPSRADAVAATASRPASRDDRETPLVAGGMPRLVRQNRTYVNSNIFADGSRPSAGVFCPSGSTTDGRSDRAEYVGDRDINYPYSTRGSIVTMPGHSVSSSTKPIMIIR